MEFKDDFNNDYDNKIVDSEEVDGTDVKINPDVYIHFSLLRAQNCLTNPNTKDGFIQFVVMVEHIEILAKSSGRLPENYAEEIKKYQDEIKTQDLPEYIKLTRLSHKKLELILTRIFDQKTLVGTLKG